MRFVAELPPRRLMRTPGKVFGRSCFQSECDLCRFLLSLTPSVECKVRYFTPFDTPPARREDAR